MTIYYILECEELESLNRGSGIRELWEKLPTHIQRDWAKAGLKYLRQYNLRHPLFALFVSFLRENARNTADDNFAIIEKKLSRKSTTMYGIFHQEESCSTFQFGNLSCEK